MDHQWRFYRAGGTDQVRLDSGADLLALDQLDQKLWVALSCPTRGLEIDERTLQLIDSDQDGRIRVPELLAAVRWAGSLLKDADELVSGHRALPLEAINAETAEGGQILRSAREILKTLGKEAQEITVEDVAAMTRLMSQTRFNGDGVIVPESADGGPTRVLIEQILSCVEPVVDRSGRPGLSQALVDQFFAEARAWVQWDDQGHSRRDQVLPLGEATAGAVAAFEAVRAKVDDYFTRCRLAEFDPRAGEALNRLPSDYAALGAQDLTARIDDIAAFPLARVEPGRSVLPLRQGINPAWIGRLAAFTAGVVEPLLGAREELTVEEWGIIGSRLAPYQAWQAARPASRAGRLGVDRLREILDGPGREALGQLIAADLALEPEFNAILSVERLVRYHRDLHTLLKNFVNFSDFFSARSQAAFQAGTLYLDRRRCDLCVRVEDMAKHSVLAGASGMCLAYCDCTRRAGTEKMTIVAAFTAGDADFLMVGRNGVFYDRRGQDWDATIVKLVENPISVRQAFWSPYKRIGRMIQDQIAKFAAARDKAVQEKAAAGVADVGAKVEAGQAPAPAPFDIAKFAGIFAAIGLALGALGSAVAAVVTGLLSLAWWQIPLALAGIILVISGPSMLLAWLKLRQRNLGPLLDATGWAINARVRINIPFGSHLTGLAALPPGARRSLRDPYAPKRFPWLTVLAILIILAAGLYAAHTTGLLHKWIGLGP